MIKSLNSTGKYGLVDSFYQHIWLTISNEEVAHYTRKTFQGKTQMWVFDLTQFQNYSSNVINSNVSLDWQIKFSDYDSPHTFANLTNNKFDKTQINYSPDILLKIPNQCPVPKSRQKDLQNQMLLYANLVEKLIGKYGTHINKLIEEDSEFFNIFNKIFQTELDTNVINEQIYQLAINTMNDDCIPSFVILNFLNRQYE